MGGDYEMKTRRGYDFFEVASALQKEIRRGNEKNALYWAFQLLPEFEGYFWSRLKVIVNEDIGIANPTAIILIQVLSDQYFEFRKRKKDSALLMVTNAILFMCRSPKTRVADHLLITMKQEILQDKISPPEMIEIPDYALDKHTKRGKAQGRGWDHFREFGTVLKPKADIDDPYEERAYKLVQNYIYAKFLTDRKPRKYKEENGSLFPEEE